MTAAQHANMPGVPFVYMMTMPNTVMRIAEINVVFTPFANTQRYNLTFTMTAAALAAGTWVSVTAKGRGQH